MVLEETPAFDKSLTEEYGRSAMIFFAVAEPTFGKLSKSFSLAVFRSTCAFAPAVLADLAGAVVADFGGSVAAEAPPTVTCVDIFLMMLADRPVFDKSATEKYGLPAMIFFADAELTPGRLSKSFSLAVFKSTLAAASVVFEAFFDF
mgnify:CR=1 FL=1